MDLIAVLLLVIIFFSFASQRFVAWLRRNFASRVGGLLLAGILLVPYLLIVLQGVAGGILPGILRMVTYLLAPTLTLLVRPRQNKALDGFDIFAILALWLPIEFDWLPEAAAHIAAVELPVQLITAIDLGFLLFLVIRPLDNLGYSYRFNSTDIVYPLAALGAYCLVALPLGVLTGFIVPRLATFEPGAWLVRFLMIYFLNALPEELLFRGVIQNLVEQRFGRNWQSLAVAALVFGLSHINNTTAYHAPPNWPYVLLATLAGLAYGWSWQKTGKITGSAITHTLVNFIWGVIFRS